MSVSGSVTRCRLWDSLSSCSCVFYFRPSGMVVAFTSLSGVDPAAASQRCFAVPSVGRMAFLHGAAFDFPRQHGGVFWLRPSFRALELCMLHFYRDRLDHRISPASDLRSGIAWLYAVCWIVWRGRGRRGAHPFSVVGSMPGPILGPDPFGVLWRSFPCSTRAL